ncbi:hypothetical protein [Terrisporobacter hibernicus]|uniref:hypothetical protein n=1 Tax=Terrisporobacter hibernicus TaxID=2813371 RepID=UPI0023F190BB|nr:hypothetical protein [Terrisporobacter hibernicus]
MFENKGTKMINNTCNTRVIIIQYNYKHRNARFVLVIKPRNTSVKERGDLSGIK